MDTPFCSLADLSHIDSSQLCGRSVILAPVWDGYTWQSWTPVGSGKLLKLPIIDLAQSHYFSREANDNADIHIPFIEFMWQHMSWPDIFRLINSLSQDIHLLAASAAKLEHFYEASRTIGPGLIAAFVNSEIEYMLVVARSTFDLLQEALAIFWNRYVRLLDPVLEKERKQRPMQKTFSKTVLDGETLRTAEKISQKYSIPSNMANMYAKHAPFFKSVRRARNSIVHFGKTPDSVFITDRGFCVNPKAPYFSDFSWSGEHYHNENVVTLVPWLAWLVGGTLETCSDILFSLSGQIQFPPPLAPDYHLFLRDPTNSALLRLARATQHSEHWWRELQ